VGRATSRQNENRCAAELHYTGDPNDLIYFANRSVRRLNAGRQYRMAKAPHTSSRLKEGAKSAHSSGVRKEVVSRPGMSATAARLSAACGRRLPKHGNRSLPTRGWVGCSTSLLPPRPAGAAMDQGGTLLDRL
jgi:hypothetical protein